MATALAPLPAAVAKKPRGRRLLISTVSLLVFVWAAPILVAHSPILGWIVGLAASGVKGTVTVGSASLGWFSAPVLRDIQVRDEAGKAVVTVGRIEVGRSLLSLVRDHSDLGTIRLDNPIVNVVMKRGKTNLELLLSGAPETPESKSGPTPRLQVVCTGARINVDDQDRGLAFAVDSVQVGLDVSAPPALKIDVRGKIVDDGGSVEIAAALAGTRLTIDKVELTSRLGNIALRGAVDWGRPAADNLREPGCSVAVDVDLAKLAAVMPKLLHLHDDVKLTEGRLVVEATSAAQTDGAVWDGKVVLSALRGQRAGRDLAWPEPLTLTLQLHQGASGPPRLSAARLAAGFGKLEGSGDAERLIVKGEFDLDQLGQALRQFCDLGVLQFAGKVNGEVHYRPQTDGADLPVLTVAAKDLRLALPGVNVHEPQLDVKAAVQLRGEQVTISDALLSCATIALQAKKLDLDLAKKTAVGKVAIGALLERLQGWTPTNSANAAPQVAGLLQGFVDIQAGERLSCAADLSIKDFRCGPAAAPTWKEALVRLTARGVIDPAADRLDLESVQVASSLLACNGKLACTELASARRLDFTGQLAYDLEKLEPFLRPYLGDQVKIAGKGTRPVQVSGALTPANGAALLAVLQAEANLQWTSVRAFPDKAGKAYGCEVGPADLQAKLTGGALSLSPLRAACNGGNLHLAAKLRLEPGPMELDVPAGPMLDKVQLTPGLCASGLRYAMPLLADVAEADGKLSLALERAKLPVNDTKQANIKGTLVLHNAKVAPGPAIRKLNEVLRLGAAYGTVRESNVPFAMENGKVRHENLELVFPDFTLKTSGTVDLNGGALDLVGELAITAKSAAKNPLLAGLAKQPWKLPIKGTMDSPQVDVRGLSGAAVSGALENLVAPRLDQGLKKLLPTRP